MSVRRESDRPPPRGFALVRTSSGPMLLPRKVADEIRAAEEKRFAAAQARERAKARRKEREAIKAASGASTDTAKPVCAYPAEPKPGFYRVFPRFAEQVIEGGENLKVMNADHDVRERQRALRERLTSLGPDRRIARPTHAVRALDTLEAELPNFGEPIRLIRNTLAVAEGASGNAERGLPLRPAHGGLHRPVRAGSPPRRRTLRLNLWIWRSPYVARFRAGIGRHIRCLYDGKRSGHFLLNVVFESTWEDL